MTEQKAASDIQHTLDLIIANEEAKARVGTKEQRQEARAKLKVYARLTAVLSRIAHKEDK